MSLPGPDWEVGESRVVKCLGRIISWEKGLGKDWQQTIAGEGVPAESSLNINAGGGLAAVGAHGEVSMVIWAMPIVLDTRERSATKNLLSFTI